MVRQRAKSFFTLHSVMAAAMMFSLVTPVAAAKQEMPAKERPGVLVLFDQKPGLSELSLARDAGGRVKYHFQTVPGLAIADVPESACEGLRRNPHVVDCVVDGEFTAVDAEMSNSWGVQRIGSEWAHTHGYTGSGIKVAVLDTGIDYNHPDLAGNYAGGWDFVNNDADPLDDNGHGTHVAGIFAALDDAAGVVGVAPDVELYALKVMDSQARGNWSSAIAALDWAVQNGIRVTNNSYVASANPGALVEAAFNAAEAAGIVNVAAAGNTGNCAGTGNNIAYPARYAAAIAVAAMNSSDIRACFSSTGPDLELIAPGVAVTSTWIGGGYVAGNGTSMASPHVAGVAALMLGVGVTDTNGNGRVNDEVRAIMNSTADDIDPTPGRDALYGYGVVDVNAAMNAVIPDAVAVAVSTDKAVYYSEIDTNAVLTVKVENEHEDVISRLGTAAFTVTVNDTSVPATFSPLTVVRDGRYSASLNIADLPHGSYTAIVTVTDTRGVSGSGSVSFSKEPATVPVLTRASDIAYWTVTGGRDLRSRVTLTDNLGNLMTNATMFVTLRNVTRNTALNLVGIMLNPNGQITFGMRNAPSGCYRLEITNITNTGLPWDRVTPANEFCK